MRKIVLSLNITEDGFIAGPDGELDWHFPFWNTEMCESLAKLVSKADSILLGRNTYTAFAAYWQSRRSNLGIATEDIVLAELMNRYHKVVISKTLEVLTWMNSSLIKANILNEITKLKQQSGEDIILFGSLKLVAYLLKHNLIDEYELWLHPISIRHGKRLPKLANLQFKAKPIHKEHFTTGVTRLSYKEPGS